MTTSPTFMLDGTTTTNNNNNDNDNNNDDKSNNNNLSVSESDNEGVGKRLSTDDILALHHEQLVQKEGPVLLGGTGSIHGLGAALAAAAANPVPPVITTST